MNDEPTAMPVATAQEIADGLVRLLVWARRNAPAQTNNTGMTTLATLHSVGPLRVSELAEREGLTQPGMTTLVNRFVDEGLAERLPDPSDRRAALVRLTDAGRQVLAERMTRRAAAMLPDVEALPAHHQAALVAALDAIRDLTDLG